MQAYEIKRDDPYTKSLSLGRALDVVDRNAAPADEEMIDTSPYTDNPFYETSIMSQNSTFETMIIFDDNSLSIERDPYPPKYKLFIKEVVPLSGSDPLRDVGIDTTTILKEHSLYSFTLNRSVIYHVVVESRYGMAHWTDLTYFLKIFLSEDSTPLNPMLRPTINTLIDSRDPNMDWVLVPTNDNDNRYPPFNAPPGATQCDPFSYPPIPNGGGVNTIDSGWNIRAWFYASNVYDKVVSTDFSKAFSVEFPINKFTGVPGSFADLYQGVSRRVKPTYEHPQFGTMTLTPNDYAGVIPSWTTGGTDIETREVSIDISNYDLHGRYLAAIFQIYSYDRYQVSTNNFPINGFKTALENQGPTNPYSLYNQFDFRVPKYYEHIWDNISATLNVYTYGSASNGKPSIVPFEVTPLSTAPHIKRLRFNYNIINFDIFLDRESSGAKVLSLDHRTKYYQWRSIQNFYTGRFETGYIVREP